MENQHHQPYSTNLPDPNTPMVPPTVNVEILQNNEIGAEITVKYGLEHQHVAMVANNGATPLSPTLQVTPGSEGITSIEITINGPIPASNHIWLWTAMEDGIAYLYHQTIHPTTKLMNNAFRIPRNNRILLIFEAVQNSLNVPIVIIGAMEGLNDGLQRISPPAPPVPLRINLFRNNSEDQKMAITNFENGGRSMIVAPGENYVAQLDLYGPDHPVELAAGFSPESPKANLPIWLWQESTSESVVLNYSFEPSSPMVSYVTYTILGSKSEIDLWLSMDPLYPESLIIEIPPEQ
ncbi:MAG: hypothetical protein AAF570_05690 [Bacteroidota bacterium]